MKIYLDPRNPLDSGYLGKYGYANMGYKAMPCLIHFDSNPYDKRNIREDRIVSVSNNFSFSKIETCDLVLYTPQPNETNDAFHLWENDLEDMRVKSYVDGFTLSDKYINRFHPLIFMFCKSVERIIIDDSVEDICSRPNAFCECTKLKSFFVRKNNKRYFHWGINSEIGDEYYNTRLNGIPDMNCLMERNYLYSNGFTSRICKTALHTFPCGNEAVRNTVWVISAECIKEEALLGEIKSEFLELVGVTTIEGNSGTDYSCFVKKHTIVVPFYSDEELISYRFRNALICSQHHYQQIDPEFLDKEYAIKTIKREFEELGFSSIAFK